MYTPHHALYIDLYIIPRSLYRSIHFWLTRILPPQKGVLADGKTARDLRWTNRKATTQPYGPPATPPPLAPSESVPKALAPAPKAPAGTKGSRKPAAAPKPAATGKTIADKFGRGRAKVTAYIYRCISLSRCSGPRFTEACSCPQARGDRQDYRRQIWPQ